MRRLICCVLAVSALQISGCGEKTVETSIKVSTPVPTGADALKPYLEDLVAKGMPVGSGGMVMQSYVDQIAKTDEKKAKALQPGVDAMMGLNDPAKIKAKAKEMLQILAK